MQLLESNLCNICTQHVQVILKKNDGHFLNIIIY